MSTHLSRRILIAINFIQSFLGSIENEFGRIVSTVGRLNELNSAMISFEVNAAYLQETLAHIDDRLDGGRCGSFVDDGPWVSISVHVDPQLNLHRIPNISTLALNSLGWPERFLPNGC